MGRERVCPERGGGVWQGNGAYKGDLGVWSIAVGKVVDIALRLCMPHQYDPARKDSVILGRCPPASTHTSICKRATYERTLPVL